MTRAFFFLLAPQIIGLLPFLLLRRFSIFLPLVLGPAAAAVCGAIVGAVARQSAAQELAQVGGPRCGMEALGIGLMPVTLAVFHCTIGFVINAIAVASRARPGQARG